MQIKTLKTVIATILFVIYITASSGATIDFHYCMGKLIDWDLSLPTASKCSNCGMTKENKKGCCNDKHQTFEIKKEQLAAQVNSVPANSFFYIGNQYFYTTQTYSSSHNSESYSAHSPPGLHTIPTFILNCVFRI